MIRERKPALGFLQKFYQPDSRDGLAFGDFYKPPEEFTHGQWFLIATFTGIGDGQTVEVWEARFPARFYRIKALPGKRSDGKKVDGFELGTGSGEEELAAAIARAISRGMLALE